jgi:peptidoglycan/LPS O-acetylase OafA/YrhL
VRADLSQAVRQRRASPWELNYYSLNRCKRGTCSWLRAAYPRLYGGRMTDHRANNFDGLRLIAALFVLLAHTATTSGRGLWLLPGGLDWGRLGVLIFFAISGHLVAASWNRDPDPGRFLARRFRRIAPGLCVAVPVSLAVVATLGQYGFPDNPLHSLNGSLWTIEYEVACYLLLVTLMLYAPQPFLIAAVMCALGAALKPEHPLSDFAPVFLVGATLHRYPVLRRWSWAVVGLGVAVLPYRPTLAFALIVPPLVIAIGARSWPVLRSAGRLGDLSYGVYIYAWPVQQLAVSYLGADAGYFTLLSPALLIVLPLAWLSWRYVESAALGRYRPEAVAYAATRDSDRSPAITNASDQ